MFVTRFPGDNHLLSLASLKGEFSAQVKGIASVSKSQLSFCAGEASPSQNLYSKVSYREVLRQQIFLQSRGILTMTLHFATTQKNCIYTLLHSKIPSSSRQALNFNTVNVLHHSNCVQTGCLITDRTKGQLTNQNCPLV